MDKGVSVIARLKNKAKQTGRPLQLYLRLFCQEEFLRKLALSSYSDNLVLKGGMYIYTLTNFESRPTVDVDFLVRHLPNDIEQMKKVVSDILAVDTGNDFVELSSEAFDIISPRRKYAGVSFKIVGKIKNTRTPFYVDMGVGDVIVPKAEKRSIPVQMDDFVSPEINTYSLESTVAEKFDAILQRLELTSRMKDFYDIYYLSNMFDFDGYKLQTAVYETLQNRGTPYDGNSLDAIRELADDGGMAAKWKNFLKSLDDTGLDFREAVDGIVRFMSPVWSAMMREDQLLKRWNKEKLEWV